MCCGLLKNLCCSEHSDLLSTRLQHSELFFFHMPLHFFKNFGVLLEHMFMFTVKNQNHFILLPIF
jgi:hypothetical protein